MIHQPEFHILDNTFTGADDGLQVPSRWLGVEGAAFAVARTGAGLTHANSLLLPAFLKIDNLDRTDPPDYHAGGVPRGQGFNRNVFRLDPTPRMPRLEVRCVVSGFDPSETPILWRLQCLHVLCRHRNLRQFRYGTTCEKIAMEWHGKSRAPRFTLFDPASHDVTYDYGDKDEEVSGGHAILTVAARLPGRRRPLMDFVHLRIGGANPGREEVLAYVARGMAGRDANIVAMIRSIFAHESGFRQFNVGLQRQSRMRFERRRHRTMGAPPEQPDCSVRFDWPDDPPHFPLVTFDFGIGISQYTFTRRQPMRLGVAWDWRENIKIGVNLLLSEKLRRTHEVGSTWRDWARRAWKAYNGSGDSADHYADTLAASTEGQAVATTVAPALSTLTSDLADLPEKAVPPPAPSWPPEG